MSLILLVEDEQPIAHLIRDLLEDEGHEVLIAADGREALAILQSSRPDLIISDIMMPLMDGIELGRRVRSDARHDSVPIILMTAARKLGRRPDFAFEALVTKPFEIVTLLETIEDVLKRKDRRDDGDRRKPQQLDETSGERPAGTQAGT